MAAYLGKTNVHQLTRTIAALTPPAVSADYTLGYERARHDAVELINHMWRAAELLATVDAIEAAQPPTFADVARHLLTAHEMLDKIEQDNPDAL